MRAPTCSTLPCVSSTLQQEEWTPFDLEDVELEEYAEQYARMTALAEFEDLAEEELSPWSDIEDLTGDTTRHANKVDSMDVS